MKKLTRHQLLPLYISKNIKLLPLIIAAFLLGLGTQLILYPDKRTPPQTSIQAKDFNCRACFTPGQACLPMIIREIDLAKKSIQMQAYSLTSKPIAEALTRAKMRGVNITVLADKSQKHERYTQINNLKKAGLLVYIDEKPAIAHNKIIIIDEETIVGGSYNFSNSAEKRNAENVTIIKNREFAALYAANFKKRLAASTIYTSSAARTNKKRTPTAR